MVLIWCLRKSEKHQLLLKQLCEDVGENAYKSISVFILSIHISRLYSGLLLILTTIKK